MHMIGHVRTGVFGSEDTFEFDVADDATEEDIGLEAEAALWESGVLDFWWEKDDVP